MLSHRRFAPFAMLAAVALSAASGCSGGDSSPAPDDGVPLTGIQITPADALVFAGSAMQLQAQGVLGDGSIVDLTGAVTWTSSNEQAATVSAGGVVTAVAVGDATITASDAASGFTAYAVLHVTDVPGAVSSLTLSRGSVTGGDAVTGTVTLNTMVDRDVVVTLWSDDPAAVAVPPSVTVPAGMLAASFDVATSPVAAKTQVLVHAWDETFDETYARTASLNVRAK